MAIIEELHGECDPRFAAVRDELARNFRERGEVGASVCVVAAGGRTVVDLWGGLADRRRLTLWGRDTLCLLWSCTKGVVAACAGILASRGLLDLDAPVVHYWPEFAASSEDKEKVTPRLILSHQAGLPGLRQPLPPGALYDWDFFTRTLADEPLFWEPGTRQGYHAFTFGHLVGELVRRISGKTLRDFVRDEITGPRGLDLHLGIGPGDEARVAPTARPDPVPAGEVPWRFLQALEGDPQSIQALITRNSGLKAGEYDSPQTHAAGLPSFGALGNGRSLAGVYAALLGGGLVDADTLRAMAAVQSASACDAVLLVGLRFALGFMKSSDNRRALAAGGRDSLILSEAAFGHAGMGGSLGFADPAAGVTFGYVMNKQGRGVLLNERGQSLVDAVYRALGARSDATGAWA
jgi:CubicO group peptidase (beta-lactamase class C family)